MIKHSSIIAIALAASGLLSTAAQAQPTAKEQYAEDSRRIAARYADDKKICAGEGDSATRMQCNRDAKTEYDKAIANAKAVLKSSSGKTGGYCAECGKVLAVNVSEKEGEGSALGVIAGGVAGALLGNQVGSGHGRQLATVAGAAGGAYAGNQIEKKAKSSKVWTVQVRYEDGHEASFPFDHDPGLLAGDRVRNANGSVVRD
ncbi:MAG: glycine zipper 2TM domain-containing protein [Paucibacter sp.]|nr:glycine zipper 2TM domain-containing protein [Roseateles sp.]